MTPHATVEVPRWALVALVDGGRLCKVCIGTSPSWDGHDSGCEGHARQVLRAALLNGGSPPNPPEATATNAPSPLLSNDE